MPISFSVDDMATSIQFAIAPIFLLVGTGSFLNLVTTRLGRVVDRARALEKLVEDGEEAVLEARHLAELKLLDQRMRHGNRAVFFCAWSAVLICFLVAVLFLLDLASLPAGLIIALVFIGVMACLSVGLISFLQEVALATKALRVRTEVLSRKSGL